MPFIAASAAGVYLLWPREATPIAAADLPTELVDGTVNAVGAGPCRAGGGGGMFDCRFADVLLTSGPDDGETIEIEVVEEPAAPDLRAGDRIVLAHSPESIPELQYYFVDYQRRLPLAILAGMFAVVVVALGRWRGVMALVGFGLTLLVLVRFVIPSILAGNSPLAVAIAGSSLIMFLAVYLAHGLNVRTTSAILGTFASLLLTGLLALVFVEAARLTGFSSEEAFFLRAAAGQVNLQGLVLGGIIIGSLGVLDDVTITQASAVWELRAANPSYGAREIYRSALKIGRDHIVSTVNTLLLAYAGASLPLLILFSLANASIPDVINGELIAEEVVRTLVGSIGLVASVR